MAIDRIPGVGPTNADIATAVAAPSAATIAAAVAAPSSATIASAVAAAVPTTAGITSIVQANAGSPFGGTWTNVGQFNMQSTNNYTISGLSGYKYIKILLSGYTKVATGTLQVRFNGDTSGIYWYGWYEQIPPSGGDSVVYGLSQTQVNFGGAVGTGQQFHAIIEIEPNNATTYKSYKFDGFKHNNPQGQTCKVNGIGGWNSTAAISSISFLWTGTTQWDNPSYAMVLGGN